jgi:hypothetical protein|tara:strand:- start:143 stop:250 length:108 start_codon:yes stop_codon:yes gene_type:complete
MKEALRHDRQRAFSRNDRLAVSNGDSFIGGAKGLQ